MGARVSKQDANTRDQDKHEKGDAAAQTRKETAALERGPMPQCFVSDKDTNSGQQPIRILAYGDSLTAGYYRGGKRFAPYGKFAIEQFPAEIPVECWVCGLSGETAANLAEIPEAECIRDVLGRKGKGLSAILDGCGPFDLVLIMLGTNDLASANSEDDAQEICEHIKKLHTLCHEAMTPTVALSVPENAFLRQDEEYASYWHQVNSLLRHWSADNQSFGCVPLFIDTGKIVPWFAGSKCWEQDGLHFSPAGSKQLGTQIAELLVEHFAAHGAWTSAMLGASTQKQLPGTGASAMPDESKEEPKDSAPTGDNDDTDGQSLQSHCHRVGSELPEYS